MERYLRRQGLSSPTSLASIGRYACRSTSTSPVLGTPWTKALNSGRTSGVAWVPQASFGNNAHRQLLPGAPGNCGVYCRLSPPRTTFTRLIPLFGQLFSSAFTQGDDLSAPPVILKRNCESWYEITARWYLAKNRIENRLDRPSFQPVSPPNEMGTLTNSDKRKTKYAGASPAEKGTAFTGRKNRP